jgi:hypothetical protein
LTIGLVIWLNISVFLNTSMCPSIEHGIMPNEPEPSPEPSLSPLRTERVIKRDKEGREYKCQREWREYRATDGKIICNAMVDTREEPTLLTPDKPEEEGVDLGTYDGHRLDALVLVNPETGDTFDVLKEFNIAGVPIIVDDLIEQTGWHYEERTDSDAIMIPPLKSPLEIYYLLHELHGHSDQFRNPILRPLLVDHYDKSSNDLRGQPIEELAVGIADIKRALPHLASLPDEDGYKLFDLAEKITERDAERKSLEAIEIIRQKTGIDLLQQFWWEATKFADTPYWRAAEAENNRTAARLSSQDLELQNPTFRLKGKGLAKLTITDEISRYLQFVKAVQGQMFGGGDRMYDLEERLGLEVPAARAA